MPERTPETVEPSRQHSSLTKGAQTSVTWADRDPAPLNPTASPFRPSSQDRSSTSRAMNLDREVLRSNSLQTFVPQNSTPINTETSPNAHTSSGPFSSREFSSSIDSSSRFLILSDLKKAPSAPFRGEPHLFHDWLTSLYLRMDPLNLSSIDQIDVLYCNTEGHPRDLIKTFRIAYRSDPSYALDIILDKLRKRFGANREIASDLREKVEKFPLIRGSESDPSVARKLREYSDLCIILNSQIEAVRDLRLFNLPEGMELVRKKLPDFLNNSWRMFKARYEARNGIYPDFKVLCDFLEERADLLCSDLVQSLESSNFVSDKYLKTKRETMKALHVDLNAKTESTVQRKNFNCPLHRTDKHDLSQCYTFKSLDIKVKRMLVSSYDLCYRCLKQHFVANCTAEIKCDRCKATNHITVMHFDQPSSKYKIGSKNEQRSNFASFDRNDKRFIHSNPKPSMCSSVCRSNFGRSCSKTFMVEISALNGVGKSLRAYAIVDEQSTHTFASAKVFEYLNIESKIEDYKIKTLSSSQSLISGRTATGLLVRGINERNSYALPLVYENNNIPDTKGEIAAPEMVYAHPQISCFSHNFLPIDSQVEVCLLIGRDAGDLLATETFSAQAPFVHKTPLGWAVVGSICPIGSEGKVKSSMKVLRSHLDHDHYSASKEFTKVRKDVFKTFPDDEEKDLSVNDRKFLNIIGNNIIVNSDGNLETPLPLRDDEFKFPNNKFSVAKRQTNTISHIMRDPDKAEQCRIFMQRMIDSKHVEKLHPNEIEKDDGKVWYLPVFPVIHPKKKKWRLVFDSAATYMGVSLNSTLLQGPDQNNKLRGVLTRFREGEVGLVSDVESMFHSFFVSPEDRDLMRFFWPEENIYGNKMTIYRARVHIFGNTSSPAVSTLCLRQAADSYQPESGENFDDAKKYIHKDFYVDDGLFSTTSVNKAINTLKLAQKALLSKNIRLHKIVSSH